MLSADTRRHADTIRQRSAEQMRRGDLVANVLLAVIVGIALGAALFHWAACSQEVAMCALAAMPLKQGRLARWRHWLRVQVTLHHYRHALRTAEIAAEWLVEDQLVRAAALADVRELRRELQALERSA